jgi:hypothetical protein
MSSATDQQPTVTMISLKSQWSRLHFLILLGYQPSTRVLMRGDTVILSPGGSSWFEVSKTGVIPLRGLLFLLLLRNHGGPN